MAQKASEAIRTLPSACFWAVALPPPQSPESHVSYTPRGGTMDILKALTDKRKEYQQQINTIDAAIKLFVGEHPKKRTVSAAAKRKMSLAAKKRWAEKKKAK
jgi:hypothetical protein